MLIKLFTFYVFLQSAFCGCGSDRRHSGFGRLRKDYHVKVKQLGRLDPRVLESSGLARATDSTFWTHGDGGSPSQLYLVNLEGELLQTLPLTVPNQDWEDLAQDSSGNLFIGDFGNNGNTRRDLRIYKISTTSGGSVADTVRFSYADQVEFPPHLLHRRFDSEAFFEHKDSLYLFTKSRNPFRPATTLYSVPVVGGSYKTKPKEHLSMQSPTTAAAVSPDHNQFALLGYGRLYLFEIEHGRISMKGKKHCLPLPKTGQAEAVLYLSENKVLITNEKGRLYQVAWRSTD